MNKITLHTGKREYDIITDTAFINFVEKVKEKGGWYVDNFQFVPWHAINRVSVQADYKAPRQFPEQS